MMVAAENIMILGSSRMGLFGLNRPLAYPSLDLNRSYNVGSRTHPGCGLLEAAGCCLTLVAAY